MPLTQAALSRSRAPLARRASLQQVPTARFAATARPARLPARQTPPPASSVARDTKQRMPPRRSAPPVAPASFSRSLAQPIALRAGWDPLRPPAMPLHVTHAPLASQQTDKKGRLLATAACPARSPRPLPTTPPSAKTARQARTRLKTLAAARSAPAATTATCRDPRAARAAGAARRCVRQPTARWSAWAFPAPASPLARPSPTLSPTYRWSS
jgi:hypothetical protein